MEDSLEKVKRIKISCWQKAQYMLSSWVKAWCKRGIRGWMTCIKATHSHMSNKKVYKKIIFIMFKKSEIVVELFWDLSMDTNNNII